MLVDDGQHLTPLQGHAVLRILKRVARQGVSEETRLNSSTCSNEFKVKAGEPLGVGQVSERNAGLFALTDPLEGFVAHAGTGENDTVDNYAPLCIILHRRQSREL